MKPFSFCREEGEKKKWGGGGGGGGGGEETEADINRGKKKETNLTKTKNL